MSLRSLLLLLNLLLLTISAYAQVKPPDDKDEIIRVDTQLVDVPIAVTSLSGAAVRGLKATSFVLYEDGMRQDIVDFSATTAPFEVALLLDTSGSTRADLHLIQRAAQDFIASLRPGDRAAVIAYNSSRKDSQTLAFSEILTDLTGDRLKLKSAIDRVATSSGTPYYDSLIQIADKVFRDPPKDEFRGRRAIVALTDGVDSTSLSDFAEAKEKLGKQGVVSFFIQVDTRDFFEGNLLGDCETATHFSTTQIRRYYKGFKTKTNMEKALKFCDLGEFERLAISKKLYEIADIELLDLAKASGGRVFPVADLGEARSAFKSVADEIGTKYTLGYYPTNEKRDGTYRKIKVELKAAQAGTIVRAREGYTAPSN